MIMYVEKQKIKKATNMALSRTGKTLAVYCKKDKAIKIYKFFKNYYELSSKILTLSAADIITNNDSTLLASNLSKNEIDIYIRKNSKWLKQVTLKPNNENYCNFGSSVAVSSNSNIIAIGDNEDDNYKGSVYIYVNNDGIWMQEAKLVALDGEDYDCFGSSIAISSDGNTIIVGAYKDDSTKGSAYVFVKDNNEWIQQGKLINPDRDFGDYFGYSVAVSSNGNTAIIGAYGINANKGSAFIFTRDNNKWILESKLTAKDGSITDNFGLSVDINSNGNVAVIGANGNEIYNGSAYVFVRADSSWKQVKKLTATDRKDFDKFGSYVAINSHGNIITIKATGGSKKLYVFTSVNL